QEPGGHREDRRGQRLGGSRGTDAHKERGGRGETAEVEQGGPSADACAGGRAPDRQIDAFLAEIKLKQRTADPDTVRHVHVRLPGRPLRTVIDMLAKGVARHGEDFEDAARADVALRRREILEELGCGGERGAAVDFGFLTVRPDRCGSLPEAQYYRWRVFAYLQGDSTRRWRTEPFQMCRGGATWHPPAEEQGGASGSRSRSPSRGRGRQPRARAAGARQLERRERRELEALWKGLTPHVGPLCRATCWCLDHADAAVEVAGALVEGLCEARLALPDRIARLLLISDVAHNAGSAMAPAAWCFRREFEGALPRAFARLRGPYSAEPSSSAADRASDQVLRVLRSWQDRAVFPAQFVRGLEAAFFRDVLSAAGFLEPGGAQRLPEAVAAKLAEWRAQHFSQLEKVGKSRGVDWQTSHLERPAGGRALEEVRKEWLLDRLLTYEVYAWETRAAEPPADAGPAEHPLALPSDGAVRRRAACRQGRPAAAAVALPESIDGSSLSSDDETYVAEHEAAVAAGVQAAGPPDAPKDGAGLGSTLARAEDTAPSQAHLGDTRGQGRTARSSGAPD
ncbi:unnamed protein product, partial [Prorocentrum cordatum]